MSRAFDLPEVKQGRSGIVPENIQETIDAAPNAKAATMGNMAQYETPEALCRWLMMSLPNTYPNVAFDPQVASGNTVARFSYNTTRCGFELDRRMRDRNDRVTRAIGNCVTAWETMDDLYPDIKFECQVSNPPFGLTWKLANGDKVDSTAHTWVNLMKRTPDKGFGWFMANQKTIERLDLHNHKDVYLYIKLPVGVWKNVEVEVGVVFWYKSDRRPAMETVSITPEELARILKNKDEVKNGYQFITSDAKAALWRVSQFFSTSDLDLSNDASGGREVEGAFKELQTILDEEAKDRPPFNVWLHKSGQLKTYLSTRFQVKRKITRDEVLRLATINDQNPLTLTVDRETRKLLADLVSAGVYAVQPEAKAAIEDALKQVETLACPIMPVTNFEHVAYLDETEQVLCKPHKTDLPFTAGRRYEVKTGTYKFVDKFTRTKVHYSEEFRSTYTQVHDCQLSGQDRYISIRCDGGYEHKFMERPDKENPMYEHPETDLWKVFAKPAVRTVVETNGAQVERNVMALKTYEMLGDYVYYPGQLTYLARVAVKDCGLVGAATGAGKSLMALSLIQMKNAHKALIIAPQGTMRSSDADEEDDGEDSEFKASQWVEEIRNFAPGRPCFELFSYEQYENILRDNGGVLPFGIYITYYEAFLRNGAMETAPGSWDDKKLEAMLGEELGYTADDRKRYGRLLPEQEPENSEDEPDHKFWCKFVGMEKNGIRCIVRPCMASKMGHEFDFIAVDEVHKATNMDATVTQMLIRLQPRYRWGFTATPIPNIVTNLFPLMGWICVKDWYKGERRNAAWPYARKEFGLFESTFLTVERDLTQEAANKKADPSGRFKKVEKVAPVIASPARLLKLIKPNMAYISKSDCNPSYTPAKMIDIRVPLGAQQAKLYGHFLNRGNIPCRNPLVRARKQLAYLRAICADPAGFTHGGPKVSSNLNPKTIAIMELVRDIMRKGDPFMIVSSRIGQTNTFEELLTKAGATLSRIDSTTGAENQSAEANRFKRQQTQGMLMGIKCAAAFSFSKCPNLIISSIEYSPGPLEQACGRIDRVNSELARFIYCFLHEDSIEATMYDTVATKDDAAKICLHGQRMPRDFKPMDANEVLAESIIKFQNSDKSKLLDEAECRKQWPALCQSFK